MSSQSIYPPNIDYDGWITIEHSKNATSVQNEGVIFFDRHSLLSKLNIENKPVALAAYVTWTTVDKVSLLEEHVKSKDFNNVLWINVYEQVDLFSDEPALIVHGLFNDKDTALNNATELCLGTGVACWQ